MAKSATLSLEVSTTENPGGFSWPGKKSFTNATPPLLADLVNLTTTPVALTIPAGTDWIVIVPPEGNTVNLKISGAVGETVGATLHPTNPFPIPVPDTSPSVFLFAASGTINNVQVYYI
jgi:hypothetical protein